MIEIGAAGVVEAPAAAVFDHLADLRNHWALAPARIEAKDFDSVDPIRGGAVRMNGPLGISRVAKTEVVDASFPTTLRGTAAIGRRTRAAVRWEITALAAETSRVELTARVVSAGAADSLILRLGGRVWLQRLFAVVLERLAALGPELSASSDTAPVLADSVAA